MIRAIFEKIISGKKLTEEETLDFLAWADKAENLTLPAPQQVTLNQTNVTPLYETVRSLVVAEVRAQIPDLSALSQQLGLQIGGEFRTGNGRAPGDGFTGGRFGYPGFTYGGTTYFLAGVLNDVIQVGLALATGKIYAGAGMVTLDVDGITLIEGTATANSVIWKTSGGVQVLQMYGDLRADGTVDGEVIIEAAAGEEGSLNLYAYGNDDDSEAFIRIIGRANNTQEIELHGDLNIVMYDDSVVGHNDSVVFY